MPSSSTSTDLELAPAQRRHVELLLEAWADWSSKLEAFGLGYPKRVVYYTEPRRGGGLPEVPACIIDDDAAMRVETAVRDLPELLRTVVVEEWITGGSLARKSKACGCDVKTFKRRLARGYFYLFDDLNRFMG